MVTIALFITILTLLIFLTYILVIRRSSKATDEDQNLTESCLKKESNENNVFFDCIKTINFEDNLTVEEDEEERKRADAITKHLLDARKNGELYKADTDNASIALGFPDDKRPFSSETPSPLSGAMNMYQVEKKNSGGSWDPEGRESRLEKNQGVIRARVFSLN